MSSTRANGTERLLRGLAASEESSLQSVLGVSPGRNWPRQISHGRALPPATSALVRLAALLAADASTTSLRWAVELATQAGADDREIVEVLATVGAVVGAARVVAAAPRLALAIGFDIEVDGWDGY